MSKTTYEIAADLRQMADSYVKAYQKDYGKLPDGTADAMRKSHIAALVREITRQVTRKA